MNMLDRTQTGGFVMAAIYAPVVKCSTIMTLQEIALTKIVPLLLVILLSGRDGSGRNAGSESIWF